MNPAADEDLEAQTSHPTQDRSAMQDAKIPKVNTRLYVIGDIHGRLDLLDGVIAAIHRDVEKHGPDGLTVTLGDYVDRGPASRGVLDRLIGNPFPTPFIALKGNHEALLESFLANPAVTGEHWRNLGGLETLHSYGVPVGGLMTKQKYEEAAERLRAVMPAEHMNFLRSLKISYSHNKYFLCHAGVRPGVPLERQSDHDLLWIRAEFLNSKLDFGKIVVHGHTPVEEPEVLANRINIDTGAFATGRLTCVVLDEGGHRFL
jgi:serine/threonine protein phosphatase 1